MLPDPFTVFAWGVMATLVVFVALMVKDAAQYARARSYKDTGGVRMWRVIGNPDADERVLLQGELPSLAQSRSPWAFVLTIAITFGLVGYWMLFTGTDILPYLALVWAGFAGYRIWRMWRARTVRSGWSP